MFLDRFDFQHSTSSAVAVKSFESVVDAILAHRAAAPALHTVLDADQGHVGAIAVKGFAAVLAGCASSAATAPGLAADAANALRKRGGGTASEQALVEALFQAANGRLGGAAERLEEHLVEAPCNVLAAKLAHGLQFMSGDLKSMLATTSAILPRLNSNAAGYGYILGCHAFSLEEAGHFTEADAVGRAAVELIPHDVWGLHAVAHVLEMRGRTNEESNG